MEHRLPSRILRGSLTTLAIGLMALLGACSAPQIKDTTQVSVLSLTHQNLQQFGLAFLTPSSITGQEEDKQALALSFFEVIETARPDLKLIPLPMALTAINRAGLAGEYRYMLDDYRMTGMLDRDGLKKIGQATGARYLAQLKLAGFRQESKSRWGALGLRIFETKSTTARLFLQIWDSIDGSIKWEGAVEVTSAYDSAREENVTFRSIVEACARLLVEHLP